MSLLTRKKSISRESGKTIPFNINCWSYKRFNGELLDIDIVVACVDALARNLSKMQLSCVRRDKDQIGISDINKEIERVLRRPNKYQTESEFIYKIAAMYYISNNVYIWPEYDQEGKLINLWPINYKEAHIYKVNSVEVIKFTIGKRYTYTCPYSQIIHLRNLYIEDDVYGNSNDAFKPMAELMNAQNQGIIEGIKNSALIRGLLKATQVMKEEDIREARERFIQENFMASNNGGVMMIDGKYDYTQIDSKPYVVDAETRKETREAAYTYFGVNEDFLQNKFTSEGYEAVYEGKLEPFAIMFTQKLTAHLLTERQQGFGNQIEANMSKLKYQPITAVTTMINATKELGLFTRDEYREMLGYEPLGSERGGDQIMIATNNYDQSENTTDNTDEGGENNE